MTTKIHRVVHFSDFVCGIIKVKPGIRIHPGLHRCGLLAYTLYHGETWLLLKCLCLSHHMLRWGKTFTNCPAHRSGGNRNRPPPPSRRLQSAIRNTDQPHDLGFAASVDRVAMHNMTSQSVAMTTGLHHTTRQQNLMVTFEVEI